MPPNTTLSDPTFGYVTLYNGSSREVYMFSTKPTSITGTSQYGRTVYNFSLKAGWNKVTIIRTSTSIDSVTNASISGGEWIF